MDEKPTFEHPQSQSNKPDPYQVYSDVPDANSNAVQIQSLEERVSGLESKRLNLNTDIIGLFETVSLVPVGIPTGPWQQIKIYVNGATLRLYWYDGNANVWHYVTATA